MFKVIFLISEKIGGASTGVMRVCTRVIYGHMVVAEYSRFRSDSKNRQYFYTTNARRSTAHCIFDFQSSREWVLSLCNWTRPFSLLNGITAAM